MRIKSRIRTRKSQLYAFAGLYVASILVIGSVHFILKWLVCHL